MTELGNREKPVYVVVVLPSTLKAIQINLNSFVFVHPNTKICKTIRCPSSILRVCPSETLRYRAFSLLCSHWNNYKYYKSTQI